ncbi:bifunctional endoribonuclease/protein kinase ire1 [Marasmius crinis-equi]|uniref:Bifunctional endoribonuclease/protein kinase ire1 n=1 Tax=Marasmius crinis-equi TaxID=585013 RepID=A0ABR3EPR5_9AGAR
MLLLYLIPLSLLLLTYANLASRDLARLSSGSPAYNRLVAGDQSSSTSSSTTADADPLGDSELVDIVLVASVDGKFHALNRTSGILLWSMAADDGYSTSKSNFSAFAPLVRTQHPQPQPLNNNDEGSKMSDVRVTMSQEFYIVEPQSGDIYVASTASPLSPLQRFPHSMPELVDMAPFSFKDSDYHRVFVGRKESKLISVELETGRIREVIGDECPWDAFAEFGGNESVVEEGRNPVIDLDELEEGAAEVEYVDYDDEDDEHSKKKPTQVYIGRTDYHISIYTKPTATAQSASVPPVQNLSFSVYGPNNQDGLLQNMYTRTKDDRYVASLPSGEVIAFKSMLSSGAHSSGHDGFTQGRGDKPLLWMQEFRNPIVATFDVFQRQAPKTGFSTNNADHTYVLLQPQPSLRDFHPSLDLSTRSAAPSSSSETPGSDSEQAHPHLDSILPNAGSAYIGIVEETGSLFAMSPDKYPFVAFGGHQVGPGNRRLIDAEPLRGYQEHDDESFLSLDEVTRRRREKEARLREKGHTETTSDSWSTSTTSSSTTARASSSSRPETCNIAEGGVFDLRCLVGVRKLAESGDDKSMGAAVGRNSNRGGTYNDGRFGEYYGGRPGPKLLDPAPYDDDEDEEPSRPISRYPTTSSPPETHRNSNSNTSRHVEEERRPSGLFAQLHALFLSGSGAIVSTFTLALLLSSVIFLRSRTDVQDRLRQIIPTKSGIQPAHLPNLREANEGAVVDHNALGNGITNGETPPATPELDALSPPPATQTLQPVVEEPEPNLDVEPREGTLSTSKPLPPTPSPKPQQQQPPSRPKTPLAKPPASPKTPKSPLPQRTRKQSNNASATATSHGRAGSTGTAVEESDADSSYIENDAEGEEVDGELEEEEQEGEGEAGEGGEVTPRKSKVRRGKRGKKKRKGAGAAGEGKENVPVPATPTPVLTPSPSLLVVPSTPAVTQNSLIVSDQILGFGSHGTVVFRGDLQGRQVAVKRLLKSFVTLASREVSILQESDDHPNVIRYYYQEAHADFLYIALELCPATLADIIEYAASGGFDPMGEARGKEGMKLEEWNDLIRCFDPKKALKQIASGLRHLHALKLVHRDIKPQNILVSAGPGRGGAGRARGSMGGYRMLISDFGLCKKLDMDQTSFLPTATGAMGAGTVGWRAPEILRGEVKLELDEASAGADDQSSRGSSVGTATVGSTGTNGTTMSNGVKRTRLTKSVDIFALGCLFYYTLTNGLHPFGDRFEREVNILKGAVNLDGLDKVDGGSGGRWSEEAVEARDLIRRMLSDEARDRPDTTTCLLHPFFWDSGRRLNFLQDASDRFEVMCRDPKDDHLLALEDGAANVVGNDWYARMDRVFVENLGKFRKYDGKSVQDLLRALRNKKHHYQDLPENVKRHVGSMPEGYLMYFTKRYPNLFMHVHGVIGESELKDESLFNDYFELTDQ